jgi:hypothetical protein
VNEFEFLTALILFIWSAVLVWASCQLYRATRKLDRARETLERWTRMRKLFDEQNSKWQ